MDLFELEENSDPTLPLNEASVLPGRHLLHDSQWNVYRNSAEETNSTTPQIQENKEDDDDEPKTVSLPTPFRPVAWAVSFKVGLF